MENEELLPIPLALKELYPNAIWNLTGDTFEGLEWLDTQTPKPDKDTVINKAREIKAAMPMKRLRQLRDIRMRNVDWVTIRAMRTGQPIPQEWQDYLQALADMPETNPNPQLSGRDLTNVVWPTRPDGIPGDVPPGREGYSLYL